MSHMVIYRSVDGKPGFQQTDDLTSAVEFVERLRNAEGVDSARIYRLEQVNFRFEPYYQVHIEDGPAPTPPSTTAAKATVSSATAAPVAPAPAPVVPAQPAPVVPAAAMAAVESAIAEPDDAAHGGATPAPEPPDAANGIRRGLFGR